MLTVTVSPGAKGLAGMKLPPCPSESGTIEPVWGPVCDPDTQTFASIDGSTPRKAIWLFGGATWLPTTG